MNNPTHPGVAWKHLSRVELDLQLSPSKSAKDFAGTLARHEQATAALSVNPDVWVHTDIPYGEWPRQRFDVCRPARTTSAPACVAFVHGGFWQEGSKAGAGFAGAALAARGIALATIGYTLAPHASLSEIVAEIAAAVVTLKKRLGTLGVSPDGLILAGHSAGAHLCAAIVAGMGGTQAADAVDRAILISGVYDLTPIAASYVNDAVGIDAAEQCSLSPLFTAPQRDIPVQIIVGDDEPPAFQVQSAALFESWKPSLTDITLDRVPGRDHFDILDELAARI